MNGFRDPLRARRMADMYRSGMTLREVGDAFGVTRQRAQQLISRVGVTGADGGQSVKRSAAAPARALRIQVMADMYADGSTYSEIGNVVGFSGEHVRKLLREAGLTGSVGGRVAATAQRLGCATDLFLMLREVGAVEAYRQQRRNAFNRGIEWNFTLWLWWRVWRDSGKWDQRGRGRGYCMCRIGDEGAYEAGNVYIATGGWNAHEGRQGTGVRPPGVVVDGAGRYKAVVRSSGTYEIVGHFDTPEAAALAYAKAAADETMMERAADGSFADCGALRRWRRKNDLTIYGAAYRAGVAEQTWREWEQGGRPIPGTVTRRLAEVVGVSSHRLAPMSAPAPDVERVAS